MAEVQSYSYPLISLQLLLRLLCVYLFMLMCVGVMVETGSWYHISGIFLNRPPLPCFYLFTDKGSPSEPGGHPYR